MWQDMLACMIPPGLNNSPRKRLKSHPQISAAVHRRTLCRSERKKASRYTPVSSNDLRRVKKVSPSFYADRRHLERQ